MFVFFGIFKFCYIFFVFLFVELIFFAWFFYGIAKRIKMPSWLGIFAAIPIVNMAILAILAFGKSNYLDLKPS